MANRQKFEELVKWIHSVTGTLYKVDQLPSILKEGSLLLNLMNTLASTSLTPFHPQIKNKIIYRANINKYLLSCWLIGVPSSAIFFPTELLQNSTTLPIILNNLSHLSLRSRRFQQRPSQTFTFSPIRKAQSISVREFWTIRTWRRRADPAGLSGDADYAPFLAPRGSRLSYGEGIDEEMEFEMDLCEMVDQKLEALFCHEEVLDNSAIELIGSSFGVDVVRRVFVILVLDYVLKNKCDSITLSPSTFAILADLVNSLIRECSFTGGDFITLKMLLNCCYVIRSKNGVYLYQLIRDQAIWRGHLFWEEYFWDTAAYEVANSKSSVKEQGVFITQILDICVKRMYQWGSISGDRISDLLSNVIPFIPLNDSQVSQIVDNITSPESTIWAQDVPHFVFSGPNIQSIQKSDLLQKLSTRSPTIRLSQREHSNSDIDTVPHNNSELELQLQDSHSHIQQLTSKSTNLENIITQRDEMLESLEAKLRELEKESLDKEKVILDLQTELEAKTEDSHEANDNEELINAYEKQQNILQNLQTVFFRLKDEYDKQKVQLIQHQNHISRQQEALLNKNESIHQLKEFIKGKLESIEARPQEYPWKAEISKLVIQVQEQQNYIKGLQHQMTLLQKQVPGVQKARGMERRNTESTRVNPPVKENMGEVNEDVKSQTVAVRPKNERANVATIYPNTDQTKPQPKPNTPKTEINKSQERPQTPTPKSQPSQPSQPAQPPQTHSQPSQPAQPQTKPLNQSQPKAQALNQSQPAQPQPSQPQPAQPQSAPVHSPPPAQAKPALSTSQPSQEPPKSNITTVLQPKAPTAQKQPPQPQPATPATPATSTTSPAPSPASPAATPASPASAPSKGKSIDSLTDVEFVKMFKMTRAIYERQPEWKRNQLKGQHGFI